METESGAGRKRWGDRGSERGGRERGKAGKRKVETERDAGRGKDGEIEEERGRR